ncbi:MAG: carboxypeptidase-like regulatory domain-containing protein [Schleiferiaceae bacterium]|nr:carboxypeptidase-like regulatory domain-containing protein [Schleiferiaceae bacterium]
MNTMRYLFSILLVIAMTSLGLRAQSSSIDTTAIRSTPRPVVQFSGVVITNDSIPLFIPFAHLRVRGRYQGTMSDAEGFFTLAAMSGDTIDITSLGFKKETLVIPDSLKGKGYLIQIFMARDTTLLDEITLYPWPTPERFKYAFLNMDVNQTELDIARRNLAIEELRARAAAMGSSAEEMQRYAIAIQNQQMYNSNRYYGGTGGAAILGALSNPFSWAQLFEAINRGDFKRR